MGSREQQRGRRDRFIVIPFSACRSAASVDVVHSKKPRGAGCSGEGTSAAPGIKPAKGESLSLVARLLRGFKNLSHQIFAVYDDEEEEEEEPEMIAPDCVELRALVVEKDREIRRWKVKTYGPGWSVTSDCGE
ncbi:unnamed protein product [Triticum turgidum subsp. durum]|uniref:Uncharacterized protein n=1 Tax=Triticum turgidum subsp. durum TaxID=4567 RepID=A0A9R0VQI5_TRITD|nr:unnamed protein product [Triticum turgidum subsp. durum]